MSGMGNLGANMAYQSGANANPVYPLSAMNAPAAFGPAYYPAGACGYWYTSSGAILVLFILLVIITRTIYT